MNKFEMKRAAEPQEEPGDLERAREEESLREARERAREAHGKMIPEEYAQLADTLDPDENEITYPEKLPDHADFKTKWEREDQMEMSFVKVTARVGSAGREAGDLLVGPEIYRAFALVDIQREALEKIPEDDLGAYFREKQQLDAAQQALEATIRAREAVDPAIRKKFQITEDIAELANKFHRDPRTKNVTDYFNRRSEMVEREGIPAEVAPPTVPDMKSITRAERPVARRNEREEQELAHRDTIISDTMLIVDAERAQKSTPTMEVIAKKLELIGGTYTMQEEVIRSGGRVLGGIAKKIREAGIMYGNTERKAA